METGDKIRWASQEEGLRSVSRSDLNADRAQTLKGRTQTVEAGAGYVGEIQDM